MRQTGWPPHRVEVLEHCSQLVLEQREKPCVCGGKWLPPPAKKAQTRSVDEVASWLGEQGLGRLEDAFRRNGVRGAVLCELDRADLRPALTAQCN